MNTTEFTWNDGETIYPGIYYTKQRWNGFACPMFTLDVVRDIATFCDTEGMTETIEIENGRVWSVYNDGEQTEREEIKPVHHEGADYFPVGAMGWVWEEAERFQQ